MFFSLLPSLLLISFFCVILVYNVVCVTVLLLQLQFIDARINLFINIVVFPVWELIEDNLQKKVGNVTSHGTKEFSLPLRRWY